jgi:hypothetical protein
MPLSREEMAQAYFLVRQAQVIDAQGRDTRPGRVKATDEVVLEFIEQGLLEYHPEDDSLQWIGPPPPRPETEPEYDEA